MFIILFLGSDDLPLHLQCALSEDLVLGIGEINPDLAPIENVVIPSRRSSHRRARLFLGLCICFGSCRRIVCVGCISGCRR